MNLFENKTWFKRILIFTSVLILVVILFNTYTFFQHFKQEERNKMKIVAAAQKEIATNTDLNADITLASEVLNRNQSIPLILTDKNGTIKSWQNLDSTKVKDNSYLNKQLLLMKSQNNPISVNDNEFIYYRNSNLLNKLKYYPFALLLILLLFLTAVYLFFNSTKIAEQNKLWTGMAKETAHQIGTPLSSLLGWVTILKSENVNNNYIKEIEKDLDRLNIITNRFSKIGALPELKKHNIVAHTKKTYKYLKSRSSKQIKFNFSSSNDTIKVKINPELYGWVIENLIKNAIDAMQGKGALKVSINAKPKQIKINITDSGKGISKSKIKQIFKPGFTTKKRGWGLGLSLSKRIIENYHKGKIYVKKSEINKGTTFEIVLNKN